MKIQICGSGCAKCATLQKLAEETATELGLDYEIEKVTDLNQMMELGVMMTPAMIVDGVPKVVGKVPSAEEMKTLLG